MCANPRKPRSVNACSSSWITSRPMRCTSTSALPNAAIPPTFSSPDECTSSSSAGVKRSSPFFANNTPLPNGAYTLWAEKAK